IRGNRLFGGDIAVLGDDGGRVQGNVLRSGSIVVRGTGVRETASVFVTSNIVGGDVVIGGDDAGQGAFGLPVARNRITGYVTLSQTSDTTLEANQISGCGPMDSEVGVVFGTGNRIDGNSFTGRCGHALVLDELSSGNEYSSNSFRTHAAEEVL